MEIDQLFLEAIAQQIGPQRYGMWFANNVHFKLAGEKLLVTVPSSFLGEWIRKNYLHHLQDVCKKLLGRDYSFVFSLPSEVEQIPLKPAAKSQKGNESGRKEVKIKELNPASSVDLQKDVVSKSETASLFDEGTATAVSSKTTSRKIRNSKVSDPQPEKDLFQAASQPRLSSRPLFQSGRKFASLESFVGGISNQLARNIAGIAIQQSGTINPIFFHGPTSVGKTHLLEGIYSEFRKKKDSPAPKYLTAEEFTTLFIQSLKPGRDDHRGFRARFRNISVLIIDDIHFLKGKEATQTELVHLIDYLRREGVQMIFSADRPLNELSELKSELVTRIESGIVCGIEPPERETLLKIFQQMARQRGLAIPDDVSRFVVSRFTAHARQLSGALNRLHATYLASGRPFSIEMANEALADLARSNRRTIRLEDIDKTVAEIFNLPSDALRSKSKARQISQPRMLAMWLARKYTRNALSEIGRYFGNRSHSTVVSAQKKVDSWVQFEENGDIQNVSRELSENLRRAERALTVGR